MDESFLQSALEQIGQSNVVSIKVMRNKFSGEPASYGFVNFDNDHHALMAMHKLNGKVIPNSNPVHKSHSRVWVGSVPAPVPSENWNAVPFIVSFVQILTFQKT